MLLSVEEWNLACVSGMTTWITSLWRCLGAVMARAILLFPPLSEAVQLAACRTPHVPTCLVPALLTVFASRCVGQRIEHLFHCLRAHVLVVRCPDVVRHRGNRGNAPCRD